MARRRGVSTRDAGARHGGAAAAEPQNLLAGKKPIRSEGVKNAVRLTDGLLSNEGDEWLTDVTSRFSSAHSFVEYDLGSPQTLRCVMVQADNNDVYFMSGSLDGQDWQQLWRVGAEAGAGMRVRSHQARRHAFATCACRPPAATPSTASARSRPTPSARCPGRRICRARTAFRSATPRTPRSWSSASWPASSCWSTGARGRTCSTCCCCPSSARGWMMVAELVELYPFFDQEPPLRALAAGLAALVVIKEAFLAQALGAPSHGFAGDAGLLRLHRVRHLLPLRHAAVLRPGQGPAHPRAHLGHAPLLPGGQVLPRAALRRALPRQPGRLHRQHAGLHAGPACATCTCATCATPRCAAGPRWRASCPPFARASLPSAGKSSSAT